MVTYEKVNTLTAEEVKAIKYENTSYTASLVSHIMTCDRIAKALTKEVEKHKDIIKAHEKELSENKLVSVTHTPYEQFDKARFIADYGEEVYKAYCVTSERRTVNFG